jgi:hypothetical protein
MGYQKKKIFLITRFLYAAFLTATPECKEAPIPSAEWTVMIYAQADPILNNFALRNFHAISTIGSNEKLNVIVQWNQPQKRVFGGIRSIRIK